MRIRLFHAGLALAAFALAGSLAHAQERVHALSGTVTSINPKLGMIEVATDDGSPGHFRWMKTPTPLDFDKAVSADATAADKFTLKGDHVIVFYFGEGTERTAVALHDLGAGQVDKTTGTVVKLNRRDRLLTIKNIAGAEVSFHLDPKTVADTANGVLEGMKYDLSKGDPVRVTAAAANGGETALLIAPAM
jgi:hypothetical protein